MPQKPTTTPRPDLQRSFQQILTTGTDEFIASIVSPALPVSKKGDTYGILNAEALLSMGDDRKAPRGKSARGDWELDTDTYACVNRSWEEPVDEDEMDEYGTAFDMERIAGDRAAGVIVRGHEYRVARQIMNENNFTRHAAGTAWATVDSADPLVDVNAGKTAMRIIKPNALIMSYGTFLNLGITDAVIDRIKGIDPNVKRGEINKVQLAAYFGVERVLVGTAVYNSAPKGQAAVAADIWPNSHVMLCRIGSGMNRDKLEPCIARTFFWTKVVGSKQICSMSSYTENDSEATIIKAKSSMDEKLMCDSDLAGYLIDIEGDE